MATSGEGGGGRERVKREGRGQGEEIGPGTTFSSV